jgi:hypothetical protein
MFNRRTIAAGTPAGLVRFFIELKGHTLDGFPILNAASFHLCEHAGA